MRKQHVCGERMGAGKEEAKRCSVPMRALYDPESEESALENLGSSGHWVSGETEPAA